jgi:putative inorganic carbon (hco3(-)) transporter
MIRPRHKQEVHPQPERGKRDVAFYLFCAFLVSYFGRFTARSSVLGTMHFDFLLAAITAAALLFSANSSRSSSRLDPDPVAKQLWILLGYIIVTLPFVEWPGSAVHNLENFAKSLCFFFFVVATVDTTRKLKVLVVVYTVSQVWRVLEPLGMHIQSGYWGSLTALGNWEYMDRLAGSPYDIINPNGLAFVVILSLPLLALVLKPNTSAKGIILGLLVMAMCYALVLSASRSGFLGLVALGILVAWRSKHRARYLTAGAVIALISVSLMTDLQRERYVSIFSHSAKGGATAEERITGVMGDFTVSLRRPLFGHGLGTSREANANFRGVDLPSHNLYTEVAEELGYIGLVLMLMLLWSFLRVCWTAQQLVDATPMMDSRLIFLHDMARTLVLVVMVDLFFSFASFGFSEPYWYFFGGLSVVTARLAAKLAPEGGRGPVHPSSDAKRRRLRSPPRQHQTLARPRSGLSTR